MLPNILSHRPPLQNEVKFFDLEKDRIDLISYRVYNTFQLATFSKSGSRAKSIFSGRK